MTSQLRCCRRMLTLQSDGCASTRGAASGTLRINPVSRTRSDTFNTTWNTLGLDYTLGNNNAYTKKTLSGSCFLVLKRFNRVCDDPHHMEHAHRRLERYGGSAQRGQKTSTQPEYDLSAPPFELVASP